MQRYKGHSCFPTTDGTGSYVRFDDAAAQLAAKDAEIAELNRRLTLAVAEVRAWRAFRKIQTDGMATTDADAVVAAFAYADTLGGVDESRAATDADPVLRAMVEKGSAT